MSKKKIIFIYPGLYTFIQTEIKLLSDEYQLISINQGWSKKVLLPFNLLIQFFFLLFNLHKVECILISFGGYSSFLPSLLGNLFGKKVAIIVHGTDCVSFSEINYGNLRSPLLRYFTKKSYQWASIVLPVSESLVYTENNYFSSNTLKFGYTHHLSNINTPYKVIPNGLITGDWNVISKAKIENSFITVMTSNQTERKGANLIAEVANKLPNCIFYIAGSDRLKGIDPLPKNVIFLGILSPDQLKNYYNKTQFYFQLSNFEGFGVALCEAMLCGCIPIVSNVNFLPNIVGDSGFVLMKRNSEMLFGLMDTALNSDLINLEKKARNRILDNFSGENRQRLLISTLKNC